MGSSTETLASLEIRMFESPRDWESWLDANHAASPGIWLKIAKKSSDAVSVTYAEALDTALCYGWIDGQKQRYDDTAWLQKFTPRRSKSVWSKVNCAKAETLMKNGRMQPAGLAEIERAKSDGRWEAAYEPQGNSTVPDDFQQALDACPKARDFFATLNSQNRYAFLYRIQTAKKQETRARRIRNFVDMLENHEQLYP